MSKVVKYILVLLGIILIGGGVGYFAWTKINVFRLTNSKEKTTLLKLISSGASLTCTLETNDNKGVFYISDGKVRGEYTPTTEGETQKSYFIADGSFSYIWFEGTKYGTKSPYFSEEDSEPLTFLAGVILPETLYDFACKSWKKDESMFDVPSDIVFLSSTEFQKMEGDTENLLILPPLNQVNTQPEASTIELEVTTE